MDVLSERRRALMGGADRNGMVDGEYTIDAENKVTVTQGHSVTLSGPAIVSTEYRIPLKTPVDVTQSGSAYMVYVGTIQGMGIRFYFSDNTNYGVDHTGGEIRANPQEPFDIPVLGVGKTLIGLSFGYRSAVHGWDNDSYTWTLVVDGKTIF